MYPDRLLSYDEVKSELPSTSYLLLGNGFSIGCDPIFRYESLYRAAVEEGLSQKAQSVFERLGTSNFEGVMRLLEDAEWVARVYGLLKDDTESEISRDVEVVKRTLVSAIANSHLSHAGLVSAAKKTSALAFLDRYAGVFTTNYDLVLYWVAMIGDPVSFQDGFGVDEDEPEAPYVVFSKRLGRGRGLFYLHGALHLYLADGELRKHCWSRTRTPLTELIRAGLEVGDYPLFVAEGSAEAKLRQIQRVGYLWYCLDKLARIRSPLVVYGHSLGPADQHIVDVIAANEDIRTVYLGVHGGRTSAAAATAWEASVRLEAGRERILNRRERRRGNRGLSIKFYESETAAVWPDSPNPYAT